MRKHFFNWTPQDTAQWEAIRRKGLLHFVLWYGIVIFGGILFVILGGLAVLAWIKAYLQEPAAGTAATGAQLAFLGLELLFIAVACLIAGMLNSLLTWAMEEAFYRKMIKRAAPEKP